jgi:hypothetical protein
MGGGSSQKLMPRRGPSSSPGRGKIISSSTLDYKRLSSGADNLPQEHDAGHLGASPAVSELSVIPGTTSRYSIVPSLSNRDQKLILSLRPGW